MPGQDLWKQTPISIIDNGGSWGRSSPDRSQPKAPQADTELVQSLQFRYAAISSLIVPNVSSCDSGASPLCEPTSLAPLAGKQCHAVKLITLPTMINAESAI